MPLARPLLALCPPSRLSWSGIALAGVLLFSPLASASPPIVPPARQNPAPSPWPPGLQSPDAVVIPVELVVDQDGSVKEVYVVSAPSPAWEEAARTEVLSWVFTPALVHGVARAARIRAQVRFASDKHVPPPEVAVPSEPSPSLGLEEPPAAPTPAAIHVLVAGAAPPRAASDVVRDRAALSAAPHRDASEMLLTVPGVFLTQHGGEGKAHQIFLRGYDAVHGQDLELWAGGAPVNDVSNVHGQGYADLHFLIPEAVHAVRASAGPYDPRQGDFAVAGTARFDLGLEEEGFLVKQGLGSYGGRRTLLAYRPPGEPEGTFTAFESHATDGFGPSRAARRVSWMGQGLFPLGGHAHLRLLASTYAGRFDSAGVVPLTWVENEQSNRFDPWIRGQGGQSSRTQAVAEFLQHDDVGTEWSVAPFFVRRSLGLRQNFTGWLEDSVDGDTTQQRNDATTVGGTAHLRRSVSLVSERDQVEVGAVGRSDSIDQSQRRIAWGTGRETQTVVDAHVVANHVGGYLDASLFPVRRVALRGGVRLDGLSYQVDDRATAGGGSRSAQGLHVGKKGTVDVAAGAGVHVLASYGEGFRSPQARSLGDGETAPFTTVRSYEAGIRYVADDRFQAQAAVFQSRLSRDLVFDHATGRNESVPGTMRTGLSMDLVARPSEWLFSMASLTVVRAVFRESEGIYEEGYLLPYAPQVVARSDTAFRPVLGTVAGAPVQGHLGLGLTLLGRRPLPYGEMGHDVVLADAAARARWRAVEVSLEVFNLLDTGWYDGEFVYASSQSRGAVASLVPQRHVTVGAPRTAWLTGALHF